MSDHLGCWEGGVEEGTNLTFACEHGVGREGSYGSLICGLLPGRSVQIQMMKDQGWKCACTYNLYPSSLGHCHTCICFDSIVIFAAEPFHAAETESADYSTLGKKSQGMARSTFGDSQELRVNTVRSGK